MRWTIAAVGGLALAGVAAAQTAVDWPRLTQADLVACSAPIRAFHQLETAFIQRQVNRDCDTGSSNYFEAVCADTRGWLARSQEQDDLFWFYRGNPVCDGDYPCFGVGAFNREQSSESRDARLMRYGEMSKQTPAITSGMNLKDAAAEVDKCVAKIFVDTYMAAGGVVPGVEPPAPAWVNANPDCLDETAQPQARLAACSAAIASLQPGDADLPRLFSQRSDLLLHLDMGVEAVADADRAAAALSGADAEAMKCAARVAARADLDTARAACAVAAFALPEIAELVEAAGQLDLLQGRYQDAWGRFDKTATDTGRASALFLRGLAALAMGREEDARADVARAESLDPGISIDMADQGYEFSLGPENAPADVSADSVDAAPAPAPVSDAPAEPAVVAPSPAP